MNYKRAAVILILAIMTKFNIAHAVMWAEPMMKDLVNLGVIDAIPPDPDQQITRESFYIMLSKAVESRGGDSVHITTVLSGADVFGDGNALTNDSYNHIRYLYEVGILRGSATNGVISLKPNELMTRQDTATQLGRWLKLDSKVNLGTAENFTDAQSISDYSRNIISQLIQMKIISGYPDNSFRPLNSISFAEAAVLIHKTMEHVTVDDSEHTVLF